MIAASATANLQSWQRIVVKGSLIVLSSYIAGEIDRE